MRLTKQAKKILDSQVKILKDINNFKDDEIVVTFLMEKKALDTINLKLKTKNNVTQTSYIFKDEILAKYLRYKLDSSNQYVCDLSDIESALLDEIVITESECKLLNAIATKVPDFKVMDKRYNPCDEDITYVSIWLDEFSLITKKSDYLLTPEVIRFKFKGDVLPSLESYRNYKYQTIQELILNNGYAKDYIKCRN